ncbi:MAG: methylmalonyl-CoA epimerase [Planctomycetota bacterium]|jgi:methylmalonyl-CoA/ethylmalonyl-CoA epimerase|nr:methylmalonyl-CoA epimerase [Planctomycetota bacterium]MDP6839286.1 methylmalonyl-CoA epimerase [Planctomycetota bacterium]
MEEPEVLRGLVLGLHHIAIAVEDLGASRELYLDRLGLAGGEVERVADQGVDVLVVMAGNQRVELVTPAAEDSPVAAFLARRGPGLHHIAWKVADIEAALATLNAAGVRLIDQNPRPGAHGTRIAFLHPKATAGVLMELVEDPES